VKVVKRVIERLGKILLKMGFTTIGLTSMVKKMLIKEKTTKLKKL
jgi:hypothetical protein